MRGYFTAEGLDGVQRYGMGILDGRYMWISMVLHIIFVVAAFILVVWVVKKVFDKKRVEEEKPSRALEIVKERYAKGEITKEQYEVLRDDLS